MFDGQANDHEPAEQMPATTNVQPLSAAIQTSQIPIEISLADDDDGAKWDEFVLKVGGPKAWSCAWHWRATFAESYGLNPYYFMAKQGDKIVGVLPTVRMRKLSSNKYRLVSLPYLDYAGPVAINDEITEKLHQEILKTEDRYAVRTLSKEEAGEGSMITMQLKLTADPEELWKSLPSSVRNQCRKAEKAGVTFRDGKDLIDEFYPVWARRIQELGAPAHSKKWFETVMKNVEGASITIAELDGKVIGGHCAISWNGFVAVPWAAAATEHRKLSIPNALYWRVLEQSCNAGATTFDFLRSNFGDGHHNYKKQWGAETIKLEYKRYSQGEEFVEAATKSKTKEMARVIWPKLPAILVDNLGPVMRKCVP